MPVLAKKTRQKNKLDQSYPPQLLKAQPLVDTTDDLFNLPGDAVGLDGKQIVGGGGVVPMRDGGRRRHADRRYRATGSFNPYR